MKRFVLVGLIFVAPATAETWKVSPAYTKACRDFAQASFKLDQQQLNSLWGAAWSLMAADRDMSRAKIVRDLRDEARSLGLPIEPVSALTGIVHTPMFKKDHGPTDPDVIQFIRRGEQMRIWDLRTAMRRKSELTAGLQRLKGRDREYKLRDITTARKRVDRFESMAGGYFPSLDWNTGSTGIIRSVERIAPNGAGSTASPVHAGGRQVDSRNVGFGAGLYSSGPTGPRNTARVMSAKVSQVVDEFNMIVSTGESWATSIWISGMPTKGYSDNSQFELTMPFRVVKPRQYTTVLGASITVPSISPLELDLSDAPSPQ